MLKHCRPDILARGHLSLLHRYAQSKLKTRSHLSDLLSTDGKLITSDNGKANEMNEFFTSVFTRENITSMPEFPDQEYSSSLTDITITPEEVKKMLDNLNPNAWRTFRRYHVFFCHTSFWLHDAFFDFMTHSLMSWPQAMLLTPWRFFWRRGEFLTSWHTFWHDELFWRHDGLFNVMTNTLSDMTNFLTSWRIFDVMMYFLTSWLVYVMTCFWCHDVFLAPPAEKQWIFSNAELSVVCLSVCLCVRPWRVFDVIMCFFYITTCLWRHDELWCHDMFLGVFDVITNFLTPWCTFWYHAKLFDVMMYFLTS